MEHFLNFLDNTMSQFTILTIIIFILLIYLNWLFIKTAISKGVEDGIYNAIVSLKNNGLISDTIEEIEETKQKYNSFKNSENNI